MSIKEILISDIEKANPDLVQSFYEIWQILKRQGKRAEGSQHPSMKYFGIISEAEAEKMISIIDSEFNNIEGEW